MPSLNVVLPVSLETALKEAATTRGISIESLVNAALGEYLQTARHRIYQIFTATALVEGVYKGTVPSRTLLEHGDFGVGTFENLDGEMVVLDGLIYQIRGDGSVRNRQDDFQVPFAVVCRFQEEEAFHVTAIGSLK